MSKGDIISNSFVEYKDTYTGKKVTRLTAPDKLSHHPYFYYKMVTNDCKFLIYVTQIDGARWLCRMNLSDGKAIQLTDGLTNDFYAILTSDDKYLIYGKGNCYCKMDMETLKEEVFYEVEDEWTLGMPGLSSDNNFMVMAQIAKKEVVAGRQVSWSFFEPQWAAKPHSRIVYVDILNKTSKIIHEEKLWLAHAQIRLHHNDEILYCHEGPWNLVDARLWLINADGSNMRCARPQHEEIVGHEFWTYDGSKAVYVRAKSKEDPVWYISMLDPATLKEETLMKCSKLSHVFANKDCSLMVGDGQLPGKAFIYLIDVAKKTETPLCYHGTSWKNYGDTQDAHPHPAFSPDGKFVIFTSDREGLPCVYKVELD